MADQAVIAGVTRAEARPGPAWPLALFRVVATLAALGVFLQPFLAGLFLSGSFSALKAHEVTAQAIAGLIILALVSAILYWRVGGGSVTAVRTVAGLLLATALQIILGYSRILVLHVPLGVLLVAGAGRLLFFVWREAGR